MSLKRKGAAEKASTAKSREKVEIKADNSELKDFKVDKGVPIPTKSERNSLVRKFPLERMDIGDSFLVKKQHSRGVQNSLSCSIRQYCKAQKIKHKFSVFKDPNSEFIRVWRSS